MKKERITRALIEEEIYWTGNHQLESGWEMLKNWGEDDMKVINRYWKESEMTNWKDFMTGYCDWVSTL